ncbi:MAG: DUF1186 domain-containing protein [Balneolaceae bacterium]
MSNKPVQDVPFDFEIVYYSDYTDRQYNIPDHAFKELVQLYSDVLKGKKSTIKRLHRLCKKYPGLPHFKNYLSLAYENSGNYQKSIEINDHLIKQHPEYLLGRINKAEKLMENDQLDDVPDVLGEEMHIHKLYPDRDTFHAEEVLKYYSTAIHYLLMTEKGKEAKLRLDFITEIDPHSLETERASFDFIRHNMQKNIERFDRERLIERRVQSRSYRKDVQTDKPPAFTYPEIEELYEYGLDIPDKIIQTILELPREPLITDLEHVLEDTVNRYEYFYDVVVDEGWDEGRYNFSIHAVLLLTELRSEQSLDKILDLLHQGTEFCEFWYSDLLEDIFSEPVAVLASDNLEKITNFVKEPDLDAYCRNIGLTALEKVTRFHPERRDEVIENFDELIHFHLSQLDNNRIIDTTLLSFLVWSCINISAKELLPSIKKLFEHNLIQETIVGSWEDIERDINREIIDRSEQPRDIFERYESLNYQPFKDGFPLTDDSDENKGTMESFPNVYGDDPSNPFSSLPFEQSMEPETNSYKDAGRNDPCPCGSGKKYKKCCL